MTEQAKTILIGAFILLACLAMIGVLLFLRPSVGDNGKRLFVCFTSIEKVSIGTRVTFAGKPVGEVVAISEIYDARSQPTDRSGHVCFYQLELAIDSHTVVYDTDEVIVHTSGLMGERTIAIVPRAVKKGQPSYPVTDQILYGKSGDPVEEMVNQISNIGSRAVEMIDRLNRILDKNEPEIFPMLQNIRMAAESIKNNFEQATEVHLVSTINEAFQNMSGASKSVDKILADFDHNDSSTHLSSTLANLATLTGTLCEPVGARQSGGSPPMIHDVISNIYDISSQLKKATPNLSKTFECAKYLCSNLNCAVSDFRAGKGTLGRLFKCNDFYLQLSSLLGKADTLMNDVNHYGILFHQNKEWQRERLKKIVELNHICSADDFKRYLDREMDQITLSLSRVAMGVKKADNNMPFCFRDNREFCERFGEALGRIKDLEEMLKLYRERIVEEKQCVQRPPFYPLKPIYKPALSK